MKLNNILTEKDDAFLDVHDNIMWLENEKYFTWTSKRDGWLHLYKVSRDGQKIDLITKGDLWNQYLAQQGYVVMSLDPMGNKNAQGKGMEKSYL